MSSPRAPLTPAEPPPLPQTGSWFVLHTRSRQEKSLAADLGAMGISFFLPLVEHVRVYRNQKQRALLPLFPGYVFVRGTREQAFAADRTKRVANIIAVPDQSNLEWELANIHQALRLHVRLDPYPYLREGIRAAVRSGPFAGLEGVIESRRSVDRLVLQVDLLGRAVSIELDGAVLEPLE